ncbi:MAG: hypothetical protein ACRC67_36745 [Inquilinus sp.]|uniref:hypothetical protein n=1 Tax=Inquilinus sp. TaxID=1932117 RepID=UPI003F388D61
MTLRGELDEHHVNPLFVFEGKSRNFGDSALLAQTPILMRYEGLPFWFALFIGNVVSVLLLSRLVPWFGKLLRWWLIPDGRRDWRRDVAGAGLMLGIYTACLLVFSQV